MSVIADLRACLERIDRPLEFCSSAVGPPILPGLRVEGLGMVALPLDSAQAEALESLGSPAGYGRGRSTVTNPNVRRVLRFAPDRVQFANPAWEEWLADVVEPLAEALGLAGQGLTARLHELLLYRAGDFFLPHRDGEKEPGMVATLSLQLPSSFRGGAIVIRHQGAEVSWRGDDPSQVFLPQALAWYADCEHEILPLEQGHRLVLVYNLVLPASRKKVLAPDFGREVAALRKGLAAWRATQAATDGLLVIPMQHAYSEDGLQPDWLKGTDRAQAEALFAAASSAGLEAHLALVTYRVVGEPEYPIDDEDDPESMEMGEIIDEELYASGWIDSSGTAVPLGQLQVAQSDFLDGYDTLTEEVAKTEFEGYTGNAGMELTRWYHCAAVILWHPSRTGQLLAAAGMMATLGTLEHRLRHPVPHGAAVADIARAALERWIRVGHPGHGERPEPGRVASLLAEIGDAALADQYLRLVLAVDPEEQPAPGLDAMLDRYGAPALAPAIAAVWAASTARSLERDADLLVRIAARGEEACRATALAGAQALVQLAVARPTEARPEGIAVLVHLAQALHALRADSLRDRLVTGLTPEWADPAGVQAEAILAMHRHDPKRTAWIRPWADRVLVHLDRQVADVPQPPADHARPGLTACSCADCQKLDSFLRDPRRPCERFPLRESRRQHLLEVIRRHSCDVDTALERRGSPYSLVCTKTTASYQRASARHRHASAQRDRLAEAVDGA
jgi:hypothetical protein